MRASENLDKLLPAFIEFQQRVENPQKNAEGYGYWYATLDETIEVVKNAMADLDLGFNQEVSYSENSIEVSTIIYHKSGQWISFGPLGLPHDDGQKRNKAQAAGSSVTYARRYSLAAAMGLAAEEDQDGVSPEQKKADQKPQKKKSPANNNGEVIDELLKLYKTNEDVKEEIDQIAQNEGKITELSQERQKEILATMKSLYVNKQRAI